MKKYIPFLLAFSIILAACASESTSLTGKWDLVSYGPTESLTAALPDSDASLTFAEDGTVSGSGGCNSLGGNYTVDGNAISFSDLTMTLMACDGALMEQEGAVTQVLSGTAQFEIKDGTLTIMNNGIELVLTAVPAE